jgi:hypothetical protein
LLKYQGQDRAIGAGPNYSGAKGRWFESTRAYQFSIT